MALEKKHKVFLEKLRRSGATNMWGATPYIMLEFDVSEKEASEILCEWMKTYKRDDEDYKDL